MPWEMTGSSMAYDSVSSSMRGELIKAKYMEAQRRAPHSDRGHLRKAVPLTVNVSNSKSYLQSPTRRAANGSPTAEELAADALRHRFYEQ